MIRNGGSVYCFPEENGCCFSRVNIDAPAVKATKRQVKSVS